MRDDRLDELLDTWRVEPASIQLRDAIMAGAPRPRVLRLPIFRAARFWLAGAGLVAGLAGVSCGVALSTFAVRESQAEALVASATAEAQTSISPLAEPSRTL